MENRDKELVKPTGYPKTCPDCGGRLTLEYCCPSCGDYVEKGHKSSRSSVQNRSGADYG